MMTWACTTTMAGMLLRRLQSRLGVAYGKLPPHVASPASSNKGDEALDLDVDAFVSNVRITSSSSSSSLKKPVAGGATSGAGITAAPSATKKDEDFFGEFGV